MSQDNVKPEVEILYFLCMRSYISNGAYYVGGNISHRPTVVLHAYSKY